MDKDDMKNLGFADLNKKNSAATATTAKDDAASTTESK